MAVHRLTGCSAIIVPRRIAHATRTQCLSMPVSFLGLRANILFLSTNGGNCPHRTVKERDGTSEQGFASSQKRPVRFWSHIEDGQEKSGSTGGQARSGGGVEAESPGPSLGNSAGSLNAH